ncbi:MAG: Transglutaminase domain protein [Microgenomates group bacterium GW2011_GWB1_40_9]|nr:MAG: Transglutaminase domain protein [Microgenomates group bacterium GW2011_GWC1_39_12]KKR80059.1 MAG: Transglutaminase domain protein [Microgenomates group bacterium GW2011_GWB1_40_9]
MNLFKRFLLLIISYVFAAIPIYASDFQADYDTQYAISPSGTTIVTQNVTLTNKQSNLYPKQYTVSIDSDQIKNVIAYDSKGVITPKVSQKDKKTEISVTFNDQVVGIDKKLLFSLRYENGDIAKKLGNIWEVRVPGVTSDSTLGEYSVSLQTPSTFPQNAYMTPLPGTGARWNKNQLINGGINAAYGEYQSYIVDIIYPLVNDSLTSVVQSVAIPPDTTYQSVTIATIDPKPIDIKKDEDGNWIASFTIPANGRIDIKTQLIIKTYIKPLPQSQKQLLNTSSYLKQQTYWETNNEKIQEYAKKYTTPRAIYDFVIQTLTYNYGQITSTPVRKGALGALANPTNSLCTEFTDLFIAISRAAGIPAREVVGYAYTNDSRLRPLLVGSDILHAWPEYYDKASSRWIPIDPTWGFTTGGINYFDIFDFNHIAFVIHGLSSELPYPAGSFREGSLPQKNISVRFSESTTIVTKDTYTTVFDLPKQITAGKTLKGTVQVNNSGGKQIERMDVNVVATPYAFQIQKVGEHIPPFGSISIPISIKLPILLHKSQGIIDITINGEHASFQYEILPTYWIYGVIGCFLIALLLIVWTFIQNK